MSEQPRVNSRRRYYNRNRNQKKDKSADAQPLNNTTNKSRPNKSNNNIRATRSPKPTLSKEESRSDEIQAVSYKLVGLKTFKMINSNSKQKTFRIDMPQYNHSYKLVIPINRAYSIVLHAIEDTEHDRSVIRNFNAKCKANDKSLLFCINYLFNNYENLLLPPNDYNLYDVNKLI